jgi:hypothetical protein
MTTVIQEVKPRNWFDPYDRREQRVGHGNNELTAKYVLEEPYYRVDIELAGGADAVRVAVANAYNNFAPNVKRWHWWWNDGFLLAEAREFSLDTWNRCAEPTIDGLIQRMERTTCTRALYVLLVELIENFHNQLTYDELMLTIGKQAATSERVAQAIRTDYERAFAAAGSRNIPSQG